MLRVLDAQPASVCDDISDVGFLRNLVESANYSSPLPQIRAITVARAACVAHARALVKHSRDERMSLDTLAFLKEEERAYDLLGEAGVANARARLQQLFDSVQLDEINKQLIGTKANKATLAMRADKLEKLTNEHKTVLTILDTLPRALKGTSLLTHVGKLCVEVLVATLPFSDALQIAQNTILTDTKL